MNLLGQDVLISKATSKSICKAAFTRQTKVGKLVLENFKILANSCLHTSNSRQIFHFFCLFFVFVCCRRNFPQIRTILNFLDELKSCLTIVFTSVRHFVKCHANHVNRARVLIGWQLPTHVCQSFTRQIRVYQHEKVGEKVGENRGKFYLSPTVCRLFLCRSHTTRVCQL